MKTLVTNDDGVHCPGLWAVVAEMKKLGEVAVVAPDREQSGVGTSVTFHHPLRFTEVKPLIAGVPAYAVEGTPADSVILALRYLFRDEMDLVISGINEGANLGSDAYISGTVGAALQGFLCGVSSMALSVGSLKDVLLEPAARLARLLGPRMVSSDVLSALSARRTLGTERTPILRSESLPKGDDPGGRLPQPILLNVNLPNVPLEQLKGVEITRLAFRKNSDAIHEGYDGKRRYYWIVRQKARWESEPGTDRWAVKQNYVSITPLQSQVSLGSVASLLQALAPSLYQQLIAPDTVSLPPVSVETRALS